MGAPEASDRGARDARRRLQGAAASGELDAICTRLGVRLLGVFGSASRDDGPAGDLDVAVLFRAEPRQLELLDALSELTNYDRIDLAVLDRADPVLRSEALVGLPLYEDEPGAWAIAQMAALAERRDTAWLRALELDRLAG